MNAFDLESSVYDDTFTNTIIGKMQRERVYQYLNKLLKTDRTLDILELNCGTGEDALHMSKYNHRILATDNSEGMLEAASSKTRSRHNVITRKIDINDYFELDQKFHLVFSNFGGLNCISIEALERLSEVISNHLYTDGSVIAVIMPKHTLIEKWYRKIKNQSEKYTSRSSTDATKVTVNDGEISTYYFDPSDVRDTFASFKTVATLSVGFIPSYLEKNVLLPILLGVDRLFTLINIAPRYADHFLIHLKKVA